MKGSVQPHTVGLAFGVFMGMMHALWSLLVATDLAKGLMDWIFGLHFLVNPYHLLPFDMGTALTLVIVTFVVGYGAGWVIGNLWNWSVKR